MNRRRNRIATCRGCDGGQESNRYRSARRRSARSTGCLRSIATPSTACLSHRRITTGWSLSPTILWSAAIRYRRCGELGSDASERIEQLFGSGPGGSWRFHNLGEAWVGHGSGWGRSRWSELSHTHSPAWAKSATNRRRRPKTGRNSCRRLAVSSCRAAAIMLRKNPRLRPSVALP